MLKKADTPYLKVLYKYRPEELKEATKNQRVQPVS
jgi:hypothetical protein